MDKSIRKEGKYDAIRAIIIKKVASKHQVSVEFVRMSIKGDRDSATALEIKKEYTEAYQSMKENLSQIS